MGFATLDAHEQRFDSDDLRFESIGRRFEDVQRCLADLSERVSHCDVILDMLADRFQNLSAGNPVAR